METVGLNVSGEGEEMTVPATAPEFDEAASVALAGALSRLIAAALDEGLSYSQLADRGADPKTGVKLSKQYLQKLVRTPPASPPSPPQLRALAAVLRKSERRVKEAAAEQWLEYEAMELSGYDEDVRIIVGHLAGKSKAEIRQWRAMMEAAEQAKRED